MPLNDLQKLKLAVREKIVTYYALAKTAGLNITTVREGLLDRDDMYYTYVLKLTAALNDILDFHPEKRIQLKEVVEEVEREIEAKRQQ